MNVGAGTGSYEPADRQVVAVGEAGSAVTLAAGRGLPATPCTPVGGTGVLGDSVSCPSGTVGGRSHACRVASAAANCPGDRSIG